MLFSPQHFAAWATPDRANARSGFSGRNGSDWLRMALEIHFVVVIPNQSPITFSFNGLDFSINSQNDVDKNRDVSDRCQWKKVNGSLERNSFSTPSTPSRGRYSYPLDVFAMGCTLFELFTGKILFPGSAGSWGSWGAPWWRIWSSTHWDPMDLISVGVAGKARVWVLVTQWLLKVWVFSTKPLSQAVRNGRGLSTTGQSVSLSLAKHSYVFWKVHRYLFPFSLLMCPFLSW